MTTSTRALPQGSRFGLATALAGLALATAVRAAAPSTLPTTRPTPSADEVLADLSNPDPDVRNRATDDLQDLPATDLPKLEATAARTDLSPEADARLHRVLPTIRQRFKAAERTQRMRQETAAFAERETLAEYDGGGRTDPKWDDAARAFLHVATRRFGAVGPATTEMNRDALAKFEVVAATGCDDPSVLCRGALVLIDTKQPTARIQETWAKAAKALAYGHGGPLCRMVVDGRLIRPVEALPVQQRARVLKPAIARLNEMVRAYDALLQAPGLPACTAAEEGENIYSRTVGLGGSLTPFVADILPRLEKAYPSDTNVLTLKGIAYTKYAWEARGGGWANTVTPQGWKDFADRLDVAKAALTQAWELDHDNALAAGKLLTVGMGQSWNRPAMDEWYQRALAADPDDPTAARALLLALEPKWGGDPESMIRFGRDCLAARNFKSNIPAVLVEAHYRLAVDYAKNPAYWLQSGVWGDVSAVYLGYLSRNPNHVGNHNALARYAVLCHHWKAADEQFKWLGDRAVPALFGNGSQEALDEARQTAAKLADNPDEQGK